MLLKKNTEIFKLFEAQPTGLHAIRTASHTIKGSVSRTDLVTAKNGHTKEQVLDSLLLSQTKQVQESRVNLSNEATCYFTRLNEGEGKALVKIHASLVTTQDEIVRRSDHNALIKAIKENSGKLFGDSFHLIHQISVSLTVD